jgi:hypothetical protein
MNLFNLKGLAIAAAVGLLLGFAAAWVVQGWRIEAIEADYIEEKAKAVQEEYERANQISNDYAEVVRWLNEQRNKRTQTVMVEVQKPQYLNPDCIRPESGRVLLNDAVRQANAARLPDATVPSLARDAAKRDDAGAGTVGISGAGRLPGLRIE